MTLNQTKIPLSGSSSGTGNGIAAGWFLAGIGTALAAAFACPPRFVASALPPLLKAAVAA